MPAKPVFHRAPLMDIPFSPLPLGAIRPEGWLRAQLELQAEALIDALATFRPGFFKSDFQNDSPRREAFEGLNGARTIALLSATMPLGSLLDHKALTEASHRHIAALMLAQREDGCLPPYGEDGADWCARAALMQLLQQTYTATADKQVLVHMLRYAKYAWDTMREHPLDMRASARAGELLSPVLWLYRATEKRFLLELARELHTQSMDWTAFCHTMPIKTPMSKQWPWSKLSQVMDAAEPDTRRFHAQTYHQAHAANVAMGLKTPALIAQWTGGIKHAEAFDAGYAKLMHHHGFASAFFSGDELLNGASPAQGTSTEALAALMATLETLLSALGSASCGDTLETLAFGALPAAYASGMRSWQRVQQPNQIDVSAGRRGWYNAAADASAFSNDLTDVASLALHGAFPGFAASLWMAAKDGGLAAISYAPCTVRARVGGATVRIEVKTAYPFDGAIRLSVHTRVPVAFPLHLRIPGWAQGATVSAGEQNQECSSGAFCVLNRTWNPGDVVTLNLPMQVRISEWYHRSAALSRGPLLLALAPECAGEVPQRWPQDQPWAYALLPGEESRVHFDPSRVAPFGQDNPLAVEVCAVPLSDWKAKDGSADAPPIAPAVDQAAPTTLRLTPYGSTQLRISQFPVVAES